MNYIQRVRQYLIEALGSKYECEAELLDLYCLLTLVKGRDCTLEDVHDAWAVWRSQISPDHPSITPFVALSPEIQEYDRPYQEAIVEAVERILWPGYAGKAR